MEDSATPIIEYSIGLAQEFQSRMNRMSVFIKDHNYSLGSSKETILRDFLSQHAPGNYQVGQGFIFDLVDPRPGHTVSKQCDILIYNQADFPPVYSDGPIKVVYPDSVGMVIEVKTHFGKKETKDALNNIIAAKQLKQRFSGVIFAFNSPDIEMVIKNIKDYSPIPSSFAPVAILLFDKGIIIHCWHHDLSRRADWSPSFTMEYKVVANKENGSAVVVAFLLLLFFEAVAHSMSTHFTVALSSLLLNWTKEMRAIEIKQEAN